MPAYKIASGDLINMPLLKHVAKLGKPMIISHRRRHDGRRACAPIDAIMPINQQLCILQCTSGYPPEFEELNLRVIETFRERFPDVVIGFSSHDNGIAMALVAYMLGARVVEKHFTLNRAWKGTDHAFSLEPDGHAPHGARPAAARASRWATASSAPTRARSPLQKMAEEARRRARPAGRPRADRGRYRDQVAE